MRACQDISDVELTSIQINVVGTLVLKVSEAQFVVTRLWGGKGKRNTYFCQPWLGWCPLVCFG